MSNAPHEYEGIYNDGRKAIGTPVRIRIETGQLVIVAASGEVLAHWPFDELVRLAEDTDGHLRLGLAEGSEARLTIADPAFQAALATQLPALFRKKGFGATLRLAFLLAVLSVAVIGGSYYGLPRAAEQLAPLVPPPVETNIGGHYYSSLIQTFPACPLEKNVEQALRGLTQRLTGKANVPFDITVDIIPMTMANAFALPGGHVIVTDKLLDYMQSPDEFAGILAHELGHVVERHAMIGVVHNTGLNLIIATLTGGSSGSGEWVVNSAGTLASLQYSRRLERRADERGFAMLKEAGISSAGFGDLFERIEKAEPEETSLFLPPFLSSHPPTPERIAAARQANAASGKPALEAADWEALKTACKPKPAKNSAPASEAPSKPVKRPARRS